MSDLAWLIPILPLFGSLILLLSGRRIGEPRSGWIATSYVLASFVLTFIVYLDVLSHDEHHRRFTSTLFTWIPAGDFSVDIGFLVDPLSLTMCLFITGVGTLIHLYSIGYMHGDPDFSRFFAYLNLFTFSMLMLVLGDNLLLTFLGWEGVGACSYLLISFWFTDEKNASAGKKAFITNRIGDWGFMIAIFLTFFTFGSINYAEILDTAASNQVLESTATLIAVMLFIGAIGKSAQFPLYLWLPDAMAGPTPVSALIHAATMVTSGIYLLTRVNPILADAASWVPTMIAWVGVGTALFAATVAVAQNDIKKVLAYSTVSQLGYMFLAVGTGAYVAAIFHMVTHAFFKALLFLGSGSVIHGMDGDQDMRHYGGLRRLMPITSITFIIGWLAIAGVPPFSGFWSKDEILAFAWNESPALWAVGLVTAVLTAFYMTRQVILTFFGRYRFADARPEEIATAWETRIGRTVEMAEEIAAEIEKIQKEIGETQTEIETAKTHLTETQQAATEIDPNDDAESDSEALAEAVIKAEDQVVSAENKLLELQNALQLAEENYETTKREIEEIKSEADEESQQLDSIFDDIPDVNKVKEYLPAEVEKRVEHHPHESPWTMTLPLVILAGLATVAGLIQLPFSSTLKRLEHWLEPTLFHNEVHLTISGGTMWLLAVIAVVSGLFGVLFATFVYQKKRIRPQVFEKAFLADAWTIDRRVSNFMGGPGTRGFQAISSFDSQVVDGTINGVARLVEWKSKGLQKIQNGLIRTYAALIGLGVVALLCWFLVRSNI
jgi:proton-translocating NADH-quinone oxidoreductase chain L